MEGAQEMRTEFEDERERGRESGFESSIHELSSRRIICLVVGILEAMKMSELTAH